MIGCSVIPFYLLLESEDDAWSVGLLACAVVFLFGIVFDRLAVQVGKEHRQHKRPRNQRVGLYRERIDHKMKKN
jgi:hypothetical protein